MIGSRYRWRILAGCLTWVACLSSGGAVAEEQTPLIDLGGGVVAHNVTEGFDYFSNSWAVVGLKDYVHATRITPRCELVLADGLLCRPLVGKPLRPLNHRIFKTLRESYLPIITYDFVVNDRVRYTVSMLACPMDPADKAAFHWPAQDNYLNLVRVQMSNLRAIPSDADFAFEWQPRRGRVACALADAGAAARAIVADDRLLAVAQLSPGVAPTTGQGITRFHAGLPPQETAQIVLCAPFEAVPASDADTAKRLAAIDFQTCLAATIQFWKDWLDRGARFAIRPCASLDAYRTSLIYQFIGRDKGEVHAGEGFYDEQYLRDGTYQAISLAHAGYTDACRESLEHFLAFQRDDGRFESQKGQLDANGYAIWGFVEYYRLSGDSDWLRRVYPRIRKSVQWIMQARRQEKDPNSPFFGVLPAAVADGEYLWDGKHHIVGYDWQNLRGVQAAAEAARILGFEDDATTFAGEFEAYRACILRAIERTGLPYIPPSYEKDGTHWGNLEAIFPSPLLDPHDPRLTATLNLVRNEFGRAPGNPGGFIEGTIQWHPPESKAIHPYLSQFVTNSHIIRGDYPEAIDGFHSFLLHTTSTNGFPEGVFYKRREAWNNTVPHLWAAALCVTTLRNMLVREQGDELHLLSCVQPRWLDVGSRIEIAAAPTHFGKVSLAAAAGQDTVELQLNPPDRKPPARTVVHLPPVFVITAATAGATPLTPRDDGTLVLPAEALRETRTITLHVRRVLDTKPMTLASRVERYLETEAGNTVRDVPGLAATPAAEEISPADCVKLDLSRVATTNPITAPFGATDPGRPLFTGLPVGDQTLGGVPVRILDPAKNDGKALVVLNGAGACKDLPREVEVPVGVQGRYLCVLGNVTGWAPDDAGTGPWNAVAEYEIRYADGRTQTVPLIPGRTADDWASPPTATDVEVAAHGEPWHLNLMTVILESKPVRSVVIRDLGTPAAPLVAAMTVVK